MALKGCCFFVCYHVSCWWIFVNSPNWNFWMTEFKCQNFNKNEPPVASVILFLRGMESNERGWRPVTFISFQIMFVCSSPQSQLVSCSSVAARQLKKCGGNWHLTALNVYNVNYSITAHTTWFAWIHLMCWPFALSTFSSGTGIVTSVPSDAPDDIAALRDIKKKQVRLQTLN